MSRPLNLANALPGAVSSVVNTLDRVRTGLTMARPFAAPRTPFNARISANRSVAFTQLDLEDIKTVKTTSTSRSTMW